MTLRRRVISGGNIDAGAYAQVLAGAMPGA